MCIIAYIYVYMHVQQCNSYARKDFQAGPVRNEEKEKIRYFKNLLSDKTKVSSINYLI